MDTLTSSEPSHEATHNPQARPVPSRHRKYTDQEITDIVDYLFDHRSEGSGGNFKKTTFVKLAQYLADRHPGQMRTADAIQSTFRGLKDIVVAIDEFNSKSGIGEGDPGRICLESMTEQAVFKDYTAAVKKETRLILETYKDQPFHHYQKLSIIMDNSRATGRFVHQGTTRCSDVDNESDHSASMDSSQAGTQLSIQYSEPLASSSLHGSTMSATTSPYSISQSPQLPSFIQSSQPSPHASQPLLHASQPSLHASQHQPELRHSNFTPSADHRQSAFVLQPASQLLSTLSAGSSLGKRKRINAAPDSGSSKQTSVSKDTPGISSALVDVTGAMNNLSTTLQYSNTRTSVSMIQQAGQIINTTTYLSNMEKTKLYRYFCTEPQNASGLSDMDEDFRQAYFQSLLDEL